MMRLVPVFLLLLPVVCAGEELHPLLRRLALCQESWQEFRDDPAKGKKTGEALEAQFQRDNKKRVHVPRKSVAFLGFAVTELTPESAGMGLGFAATVKGAFDDVRKRVEAELGKPLQDCDRSDGMAHCSLPLGAKRTVMLVAPLQSPEPITLIGCFYEYQK